MTVPAADTCCKTLTSGAPAEPPVTIPFKNPSSTLVPPAPAKILPLTLCVTPAPTAAVGPERIWSALASIIETLIPLAYYQVSLLQ